MVGDHPVARPAFALGRYPGQALGSPDQRAEGVDVVIVMHALHHRGDALQPHAGVDRRLGQRRPAAIPRLLELHEHQVPDLDEPVAILIGAAGRTAGNMRPVVIENLAAWPARPGIAHRPEIIRSRDPDNPLLGNTGDLLPQLEGFVIGMIDGDRQLVLGQPPFAGQQRPGMQDRLLLEIVAEGKIPQHFKEGMMPRGIADIVEVIMLSARPHAFLRGCRPGRRPRLQPGEHVLERHHAGVGEHQRRIVVGHQRRGGHYLMGIVPEIIEERAADIVGRAHTASR